MNTAVINLRHVVPFFFFGFSLQQWTQRQIEVNRSTKTHHTTGNAARNTIAC